MSFFSHKNLLSKHLLTLFSSASVNWQMLGLLTLPDHGCQNWGLRANFFFLLQFWFDWVLSVSEKPDAPVCALLRPIVMPAVSSDHSCASQMCWLSTLSVLIQTQPPRKLAAWHFTFRELTIHSYYEDYFCLSISSGLHLHMYVNSVRLKVHSTPWKQRMPLQRLLQNSYMLNISSSALQNSN